MTKDIKASLNNMNKKSYEIGNYCANWDGKIIFEAYYLASLYRNVCEPKDKLLFGFIAEVTL